MTEGAIKERLKRGFIWQVRIMITQAPIEFEPKMIPEGIHQEGQLYENFRSFLYEPVGLNPPLTFGLELTSDKNLGVAFICKVNSEMEGYEIGQAWLSSLRYHFTALDGNIEVRKVMLDNVNVGLESEIYEIKFPEGRVMKRVNLVEKFVNIFFQKTGFHVQMYMFWQRDLELSSDVKEQSNLFNFRIFSTSSTCFCWLFFFNF